MLEIADEWFCTVFEMNKKDCPTVQTSIIKVGQQISHWDELNAAIYLLTNHKSRYLRWHLKA